jgi:hypothetical protein
MAGTAHLIRALLPSPEVDLAHLIRDDERVEFYANRKDLFEASGFSPPG